MLDHVLGAILSRERTDLVSARYTENGVELPVGEGLWATADAIGPYRHEIADSAGEEAACFTTVIEGKTRSHLALRVKRESGAVREIEAMVARPPLFGGADAFGDGPAALNASGAPDPGWFAGIPAAERIERAELQRISDLYFAGLEKNDGRGEYPFADDCIRIENGFRVTQVPPDPAAGKTPYAERLRSLNAREQFETGFFRFVDRIRERRFPVIDEGRGTVFCFAFFDHSGTVRQYELADGTPVTASIDRPFSWMIAEAFRVERGLITLIEALMTQVPYGHRSGW